MNKVTRLMSVLALVSLATVGVTSNALAEDAFYSNQDGADIFVDNCDAANFTVTIDGTEYGPGDVASGFSLDSNYSVSAGAGVTVGWVTYSIVQANYGHGGARTPLEAPGNLDVSDDESDWRTLTNSNYDSGFSFSPSIFYAECPGQEGRYAYVQTFPGYTLAQAGYAANLEQGVYLSDATKLASLGLVESQNRSLTFAPMSDFRNAAYAFWANYLEGTFQANDSAVVYFDDEVGFSREEVLAQGDWGVWAWAGFGDPEFDPNMEFASSFYSFSNGSDLVESEISDVFEAPSTPEPTLANTGSNVEWSLLVGLACLIGGAWSLAFSRRKRNA